MRVRNTHPNRPLMCSGLHLLPGVWHDVDEGFRIAHSGVPDLEFVEDEPDPVAGGMSLNLLAGSPADASAISEEMLARLRAESDEAALERAGYDPDPEPTVEPYVLGRWAAQKGESEDSCPFPDGRTKDAKEWRRGWREFILA